MNPSKGKGTAASSDASYDANNQYYAGYDYSNYYDPNYYAQYYGTSTDASSTAMASAASSVVPSPFVPVQATPSASQLHGRGGNNNRQVGYTSTAGYSKRPTSSSNADKKKSTKKKTQNVRAAGGEVWEDNTLEDWEENDFRLFAGDLGNEVTDEMLFKAFEKYPSVLKTRIVRDKRTGKSKGYGFISFQEADDFVKAWREMNGKYVGNRPIKLRKSTWKDRDLEVRKKKEVEKFGPYNKRR